MNRIRLLRVIACFAVVFVLGGATGWLSKPAVNARRMASGERVMENLDARLGLTDEQKTRIKPILAEWERESGQGFRGPRRRRQLLEKYAPRIGEVLTPAQRSDYDVTVEDALQRLERRVR
jgi:hypothetical protein